jgi:hypothetical protein
MAFVAGYNSRFLSGSIAWSLYTRGFKIDTATNMLGATVMDGTKSKSFIPGQTHGTVTVDALLDGSGAAGSQFIDLNTWATTPRAQTHGLSGTAALSPVFMLNANLSQATIASQAGDIVNVQLAIDAGDAVDLGFSLEDLSAIVATGNGTARDLTAGSTNGGVAHLHVSAFSGFTSDTITIEHSTDGATGWATIATFTAATSTTSQRVVVAAGVTVNRYLRVVDTCVGSGSVTRQVSFARR